MLNGYLYTGPLSLGSVVAHNCGAAGLFSDKVNPDVLLEAIEVAGLYRLTVTINETVKTFDGDISSMGRRQIGQALLRYLREYQGLPADAPWGTMVGVRPTKLLHKYIDTYTTIFVLIPAFSKAGPRASLTKSRCSCHVMRKASWLMSVAM